jgi:superfamily I DNA/RNA helicase
LRAAGVSVFWLNDPQNRDARDRLAGTTAPVILSTIHSAKGLEFPHVVLCGIWREGEDPEVNRKLAYVGMTRATDSLAVVTREGHPLVADLQRTIA